MGPLLLVWALPVVLALALLLGLGKASGLLDRLTTAVHPLVRPLGLTGRDLVRVIAGYGCNVPAVIATRSCSSCSRDATIGAIAFGSACSYQLAATLGVLAAARRPGLVLPYLAVLTLGALVHARLLARHQGTGPAGLDLALLRGRAFLARPRWPDVRREAATTLQHVTLRALPVFLAIVVAASLLAASGTLDAIARPLQPLMAALRLPGEVALPVVLASVRKDGLLLLAEPGTVAALDDAQLLAALVLAGALVPCLVTTLTIARERSRRVAARLVGLQALGALALTAAISWVGLLAVRS
jgi:ferrous iron transport protein B